MYDFTCEHCDGTVRERRVDREALQSFAEAVFDGTGCADPTVAEICDFMRLTGGPTFMYAEEGSPLSIYQRFAEALAKPRVWSSSVAEAVDEWSIITGGHELLSIEAADTTAGHRTGPLAGRYARGPPSKP